VHEITSTPESPGRRVSVQLVEDLLARSGRLIASRPRGEVPLDWSVEAEHVGDMTAIAALAALSARFADRQILIMRDLDVPRELVYKALTSPELVKRWWGGHRGVVTVADIDPRVGGDWRCVTVARDGSELCCRGRFREIVPNQRIVATAAPADTPGRNSVNTVMISHLGGGTHLSLLLEFASKEARGATISSGIAAWLEEQLECLERVAASLR
jgi:uncharacterized protein YndB with AHSA1/START domain